MEKNAWSTLETTGKRPGTAAIFLFPENQREMLEKSSKELGSQESSHPNKDLLSTSITPPVPAACWVELMKQARAEAPDRCPAFGSSLGKMEFTVWRSCLAWIEARDVCVFSLLPSCPLPLSISFPSFIFSSLSLSLLYLQFLLSSFFIAYF